MVTSTQHCCIQLVLNQEATLWICLVLPCVTLTMLNYPCAVVLLKVCIVERVPTLDLREAVSGACLLIASDGGAFNRRSKAFPFPLTTFNCGAAF